jgi:hypothetical protein
MLLQQSLKSQLRASLKTLKLTIDQCPDEIWNLRSDGRNTYWRVAYHALFFAHMYLSKDLKSFVPAAIHVEGMQDLGDEVDNNGKPLPNGNTLTRQQMLDYYEQIDSMIDPAIDSFDLTSLDCGFYWYTCSKLEHQFVNMRHIQHHAAALSMRLKTHRGKPVAWVGTGKSRASS